MKSSGNRCSRFLQKSMSSKLLSLFSQSSQGSKWHKKLNNWYNLRPSNHRSKEICTRSTKRCKIGSRDSLRIRLCTIRNLRNWREMAKSKKKSYNKRTIIRYKLNNQMKIKPRTTWPEKTVKKLKTSLRKSRHLFRSKKKLLYLN